MKKPKERTQHGMLKWIAETLELGKSCVLASMSQASCVQKYMKAMKRRGQIQVEKGVVRIWRMK